METKHIESKLSVAGSFRTNLAKMNQEVNPFIERLMRELESAGLKPSGPMEFIYTGASSDINKEFNLEIAQPVSGNAKLGMLKEFELKHIPEFTCLTETFKGRMDQIFDTYTHLYEKIGKKNINTTDIVREVYQNWVSLSSDQNIVEIQVGIPAINEPVR